MLTKSIQIAPEIDFEKYMNLAQILVGAEAISCYKRGIEVMLAHKRNHPSVPNVPTPPSTFVVPPMVDQQLCHAYCAIAELYMTDSCFDDDAEKECEKSLNAALHHNPLSADTYYIMASMRVSQQRNPEALELLQKSYGLWKDKFDEMMKTGKAHSHEHNEGECCNHDHEHEEDDEAAFLIPAYPIRHSTAKLFVELGQFKEALPILEGLVMEQDAMPAVWVTYALAHTKLNDYPSAFECLVTAKGLIKKGEGMGMNEEEDEALVEKAEKLDAEVKQKLTEQGIAFETEDDTMDDDDEDN